ncbi:MAG: family 1 glycosylhydrolase [Chloroflexota bacterium]|nr:family 1 glycosylhydrolase [Chloroflexota bacterium]
MDSLSAARALELDGGFVVATGFECSAPTIHGRVRQDELRKTGHCERFAEDYRMAASFGVRYVRFGVPFHVVARSDERREFDWDWTDRALDALLAAGREPILDLLHFGLPDDIGAVADPRLVRRYEAYVAEVAERYPWARYYTPVNEPLVTALFSARYGMWNERRRDDRSLVAAIDRLATCVVRGMQLIRERRPDAIFVHSDGCDSFQPAEPAAAGRAAFLNELRFVGWDLAFGRRPAAIVVDWLRANGMGEERLDWFAVHGSTAGGIVGHDYYRGNERLVLADGSVRQAGDRRHGYLALARAYHARYGMPFMLSETNIAGQRAPSWLAEVWADALTLRAEGAPIRGFCWYGFVDHVDWDSGLRWNRSRVNRCGLVGLDRQPHRVGLLYRGLAQAAATGAYARLAVGPARTLARAA